MRVPRSQRGGEVIEPLVRDQWFVKMQPLAEPALKVGMLKQQEWMLLCISQFHSTTKSGEIPSQYAN